LEAMAKLLYDYWFVQFDFPDENGKPYKASGGKMVWNDELKREIPAGWEAKPLSAFIAESKNGDWGNNKPKRKDDIEVTCFRGADFASITDDYHVTAPIRYISANNSDRLLSDGDLITEISGGSPTQATGRVGYINQKFLDRNGGKMDCSNFCKAFTPMECFYQYWLYQTWKAFYDAGVMFNYESKTTGIKNLMFDEFITWVRVPAPSDELLKKYQEVCSQYYDKIQEEFIESTQLASLRDFLLPMLMNGQVKVGA
ncbi:MAG: restriction endonuclease subunit S, partial [Aeriscardovia sp.]|nr:restriction endonuclease subunit S [Aeriscardovia sp.]